MLGKKYDRQVGSVVPIAPTLNMWLVICIICQKYNGTYICEVHLINFFDVIGWKI